MNALNPIAPPNPYIKEVVGTKRELMLLKYMNQPHISPTHLYELTVVLRLQELEDEQAQKTVCPNIQTPITPT